MRIVCPLWRRRRQQRIRGLTDTSAGRVVGSRHGSNLFHHGILPLEGTEVHASRRHAVGAPVDLLAALWPLYTELVREACQEVLEAEIQSAQVRAGLRRKSDAQHAE